MLYTSAIQLRALVVWFASIYTDVQRSPEHPVPATARHVKEQSRCEAHTTRRDCCLGLTEGPRNVNIVLVLPQLQQIVSYTTPCWSVEISNLQKLLVGHPSSNSTQQRVIRFDRNSLPLKSIQQTLDPLNQCARHCHQVAHVQQWRVICNDADDDDDPPCATGTDTV